MTEKREFIPLRDHLKSWAGAHIEAASTITQETARELGVSDLITERGKIDDARYHMTRASNAASFIPSLDGKIEEIRRDLDALVGRNVLPEDMGIEVVVYKKPVIDLPSQKQQAEDSEESSKPSESNTQTIPIEDLNLSVRAYNALKRKGIFTAEQLKQVPDKELYHLRNFGQKSLDEVHAKLKEFFPEQSTS